MAKKTETEISLRNPIATLSKVAWSLVASKSNPLYRKKQRNCLSLTERETTPSWTQKQVPPDACPDNLRVFSVDELDWFVAHTDNLGILGSPEVEAFWSTLAYRVATAVDEAIDPYSEAYVSQQIAVYREISGRALNQTENEHTHFNLEEHFGTVNAYAHQAPHQIAVHTARLSRAVQLSGLDLGQHVLDMGCGWGLSSEFLAYTGLRVTGLDINPQFIELVKRRAARSGYPISAVQGKFEEIPGDAIYDAALFYECLHHAVRPWEALNAVFGRLRPGGLLLLAGEPMNDIWKNWGIRTDMMSVYCIRKCGWFESGWSPSFLSDCLRRCGYSLRHFADEGGSIGWIIVAEKP